MSESANDRFERRAEAFCRATGKMARFDDVSRRLSASEAARVAAEAERDEAREQQGRAARHYERLLSEQLALEERAIAAEAEREHAREIVDTVRKAIEGTEFDVPGLRLSKLAAHAIREAAKRQAALATSRRQLQAVQQEVETALVTLRKSILPIVARRGSQSLEYEVVGLIAHLDAAVHPQEGASRGE